MKNDRKDKFARHRKLVMSRQSLYNTRKQLTLLTIMKDTLHAIDIKYSNIETHKGQRFMLDNTIHEVCDRIVIIHGPRMIDCDAATVEQIDGMQIIRIPDGELNWMYNGAQICGLNEYLKKHGLGNIKLVDAFLVTDGKTQRIVDEMVIMSPCPPPEIVPGKHGDRCAICQEDVKVGESVFNTPCSHEIHCKCMSRLILKNNIFSKKCPICKVYW
jgi:hypothetical protein